MGEPYYSHPPYSHYPKPQNSEVGVALLHKVFKYALKMHGETFVLHICMYIFRTETK